MVAMKAPADGVAQFGFGASAFATGPLVPPLDKRRVGLGRHSFRYASCLLGCMRWAGAQFDGALAVVASLHWETADAFTVFAALPVVPDLSAVVTMAHVSPNGPLMRRLLSPVRLADIELALPGVGRVWIRKLLVGLRSSGELIFRGKGPAARWRNEKSKGSNSK